MGMGLQIFDASGNLTLDTINRLGRVLGYVSVAANGSLANANFAYGTPFAAAMPSIRPQDNFLNLLFGTSLYVQFSGTTMTWTLGSMGPVSQTNPVVIFYGVY